MKHLTPSETIERIESLNQQANARPEVVTDTMLTFLDDLRESGDTNMFGARPYIISRFHLSPNDAGDVLSYWMKTFGEATR